MIPLRSRTLTALRIGQHLVKIGDLWALDIPAADTKSRRALDYPISREMSERIDLYLEQFRSRIPGADKHAGLWASNKSRPMFLMASIWPCANARKGPSDLASICIDFVMQRPASGQVRIPVNVKGVKDLLGHASFGTTQKHYIMAQSRLAGRVFARAIDAVRK